MRIFPLIRAVGRLPKSLSKPRQPFLRGEPGQGRFLGLEWSVVCRGFNRKTSRFKSSGEPSEIRMRMVRNKASMLRNKEGILRNRWRDFQKKFGSSECLMDLSVESDVPIAKH
jgi:hypothetical protein